jgi:hypothetical protein
MAVSFRIAPEVQKIGDALVGKYHTHLQEYDVLVRYWFRDDTPKKNGALVLGTCERVTGKAKMHAKQELDFFLIIISEPQWEKLDDTQRMALVDHELAHAWCEYDEEKEELVLSLRPHDLEEFGDIVKRYGLWKQDITQFMVAAQEGGHIQLTLDLRMEKVS